MLKMIPFEKAIVTYKAFNSDLTSSNFQYEIGKKYIEDYIEMYHHGFHSYESPEVIPSESSYTLVNGERLCKVKIWGAVEICGDVYCSSAILIMKEIPAPMSYIENQIRKNPDDADWHWVSCALNLSEEFIREFKDELDWHGISESQPLSEDFIREFQDRVDWYDISEFQTLSEDFIREFKDKVNWDNITISQTLSEDFIREFKDRVEWIGIEKYQNLSEEFKQEFKDELDW